MATTEEKCPCCSGTRTVEDTAQSDPQPVDTESCPCPGRVSGFTQPWLLALLNVKPSHGYELVQKLSDVGFFQASSPNPTGIYRHLRQMERDGLVRSRWDTSGSGPPRRVYEITPDGIEVLDAWMVSIRLAKESLEKLYELRTLPE